MEETYQAEPVASKIKKKKANSFLWELKNNTVLFLMLVPGLLVLLVNNYIPMFGIVIAFKDIDYQKGVFGSDWAGLDNFKFLFKGNAAKIFIRNTLGYNIVFIVVSLTVAVALAIALNELLNKRLKQLYQSIFFLPYFLSWVVVSYLVFACLSEDNGFINRILMSKGTKTNDLPAWYSTPGYWPAILILVNTWKWTGYDSIVYLAAICGFDKSYYEAAAVDGATRWQQITKITIPLLKPILTVLTLLKVGRIFYSDWGLFYVVTKNAGLIINSTQTIDTFVFRALMETNDLGLASAAGFIQAIVGFVVIMVANGIVRHVDPESALF